MYRATFSTSVTCQSQARIPPLGPVVLELAQDTRD
jgi:hypothetical protein